MPRDVVRKQKSDSGFDYLANTAAPIGADPISFLMSAPGHPDVSSAWSEQIITSVRFAMNSLNERDMLLIEGKYIWGKSYSELADMMGWSAKSSAYKAVKKAENKLKEMLMHDPFIREMLGES